MTSFADKTLSEKVIRVIHVKSELAEFSRFLRQTVSYIYVYIALTGGQKYYTAYESTEENHGELFSIP